MTNTNWCPELSGNTISLRPLQLQDFDALYAAASDREIWRLHPNHDRWQKPQFAKYFELGTTEQKALLISEKSTGRIIGSSRFYDPREDQSPSEVKIGYTFLVRDHWEGIQMAS